MSEPAVHLDRWRFPLAPGKTAQLDFYGPPGRRVTAGTVRFLLRYLALCQEAAAESAPEPEEGANHVE